MYNTYVKVSSRWVNKIPSYWQFLKIKEILVKRKEKNNPIVTDFILSLSARNGVTPYHERTERGGNKPKNDLTQYDVAHKNDLLINCMNIVAGSVGITKWKGAISPVYYALYPRSNRVNIRFAEYIFRLYSFQRSLIGLGKGIQMHESESGVLSTVRMRIPMSNLNNIQLPLPPRLEQDHIVRYLDWKISMINKYINTKKKQIELLKEQKQSIINQAVTKGLDPRAPMKNSGIEWLGKIPAHWEVNKLRYFCQLQNGISESGDFFLNGTPFVSYSDVYKNYQLPLIVDGKASASKKQQEVYSVKDGDVFFTRTSETVEEIAYSSVCFKDIDKAVFSGFLIRARQKIKKLDSTYAKYFFRSVLLRFYFCREMNLVTRVSLSQTLLKDLPVLLPPMEDQKKIGEYLENANSILSSLIEKYQQEINKMDEYRVRLISDVVTGKVDVQGEKVPEFAVESEDISKTGKGEENENNEFED
jgi:type I restriction enzyme S subunit